MVTDVSDLLRSKTHESFSQSSWVDWITSLQSTICESLDALEAKHSSTRFTKREWTRDANQDSKESGFEGNGVMRILENGSLFERAAVHVSNIHGNFSKNFASAIPGTEKSASFWACGLSLIVHPRNPHVPAIHMNVRSIATQKQWFAGCLDLNPMLGSYRAPKNSNPHPDTVFFHQKLKSLCDRHNSHYYENFSKQCDSYFFIPHRNVSRGVGGIFFDNLFVESAEDLKNYQEFSKSVGESLLDIYTPIVNERHIRTWTEEEEEEQLKNRGLYAEFNLLYDRGTLFGLKTKGNIDAIFSALPPRVRW